MTYMYMYCDLVYSDILFSVNGSFAVANPPPQLEGQTTTRASSPQLTSPPQDPNKNVPPMTHDLANDDKQACILNKKILIKF